MVLALMEKPSKSRLTLPIHAEPLNQPDASLKKSKRELPLTGDRLLVRDDGQPWAHSDWDELVSDAANAAKLPAGTCLYTLRHSWISTAPRGGMSTLEIARL